MLDRIAEYEPPSGQIDIDLALPRIRTVSA
jgi:hypothetical protein